ncbi:hypothetical protein [Kineococcus xinjiangensis]|uniref:hypothetical protein n=1 Tax=Kineococcus xinjiangensis TaxID=512762 RepID=UPI0011B0CA7F|nr:hypothetical protein [Kineococcus xinjiangensis]
MSVAGGQSGGPEIRGADHTWLVERVERLSDDRLRAERDPVVLLRTLVDAGERAFVVEARHEVVIVFFVRGVWWAATMPVKGRADQTSGNFMRFRSAPAAAHAPRSTYGWQHWSAYVRRRHLESVSLLGPADSATTLAEQIIDHVRSDVQEHLVAAALAGLTDEDRAAAEFLLAFAGHPVDPDLRAVPVTVVHPGRVQGTE